MGAFANVAAGDITTVADQIGGTPATHFATLDNDGSITMEASAGNVKTILDYIWGTGKGSGKTISPIIPDGVIFLVSNAIITVVALV